MNTYPEWNEIQLRNVLAECRHRAQEWAMIRPISAIKDEVFPQRVRVHRATSSYGGSIEKDGRD